VRAWLLVRHPSRVRHGCTFRDLTPTTTGVPASLVGDERQQTAEWHRDMCSPLMAVLVSVSTHASRAHACMYASLPPLGEAARQLLPPLLLLINLVWQESARDRLTTGG
jgi:hypothetical protein